MDWHDRFRGLLGQAFQIEHLTSPTGKSYGAGQPVSGAVLLESAIPREQIEFYADLLVDEWAAQHIIGETFELETLVEFDMSRSSEVSEVVQYLLLDIDNDRIYLGRKLAGRPLEFLIAVEREAVATLVPASIIALMASETALGEPTHDVQLPVAIVNYRPELLTIDFLRRGTSLMLDTCRNRGIPSWESAADLFGVARQTPHDRIIDAVFDEVYTEVEPL
jgi:hypothetical protein